MAHPQHHKSIRKRIYKQLEPFPHPKTWKRLLDHLVAIFGAGMTLALLPQAYEIWTKQNADSVSEVTWAYFTFWAALMLTYGITHKEKPIIITYSIGLFMYLSITIGAFTYG